MSTTNGFPYDRVTALHLEPILRKGVDNMRVISHQIYTSSLFDVIEIDLYMTDLFNVYS